MKGNNEYKQKGFWKVREKRFQQTYSHFFPKKSSLLFDIHMRLKINVSFFCQITNSLRIGHVVFTVL